MIYALIGVPLMLMCLSSLGGFLAEALQCTYSKLCGLNNQNGISNANHSCTQHEEEVSSVHSTKVAAAPNTIRTYAIKSHHCILFKGSILTRFHNWNTFLCKCGYYYTKLEYWCNLTNNYAYNHVHIYDIRTSYSTG